MIACARGEGTGQIMHLSVEVKGLSKKIRVKFLIAITRTRFIAAEHAAGSAYPTNTLQM